MELHDLIRKYRPNIREITINNYIKYLNRISKHFTKKNLAVDNIKLFKKSKEVIDYLSEAPLSTQKALIASILVILNNDDKYAVPLNDYRVYLEVINSEYEKDKQKKQKNISESKNWATMKEIENVREQLKKKVDNRDLFKKSKLKQNEYDLLRNYLISALYTYKPPRRNIYRLVKFISKKSYNKLKDSQLKENYLVFNNREMFLHFGNQKSSNFNNQILQIPKPLKKIIRLYMSHPMINTDDNELFIKSFSGKQLSTQQFTNIMSKIFTIGDRHISSSLLRKIYVSEVIQPHADIVNEAATSMGHSSAVANKHYTKK
tara:strand:- start:6846 stop:7799 length:954 start_codon:yes stop_codon:yes gene_type:complete